MLNALSLDERRKARLERVTWSWFDQMTEEEKGAFIDATMPTGFKQMLASFEQLPEDKRRRTIEQSVHQLRDAQTKLRAPAALPKRLNIRFTADDENLAQGREASCSEIACRAGERGAR